jgi:hypothetical protein
MELAIVVGFCAYGGSKIDAHYGTKLFTPALPIIGFILSMIRIYYAVKKTD